MKKNIIIAVLTVSLLAAITFGLMQYSRAKKQEILALECEIVAMVAQKESDQQRAIAMALQATIDAQKQELAASNRELERALADAMKMMKHK